MNTPINLLELQSATTESEQLAVLNSATALAIERRNAIDVTDDIASALIHTAESSRDSNELTLAVWCAIMRCGENRLLLDYCSATLYSPSAHATWRRYAFCYLMRHTVDPARAEFIGYAASCSEYRLQYAAAYQSIDTAPEATLRRLIDICESRDIYDHETRDELTFSIHTKGNPELIPYIEAKIQAATDPDWRAQLSEWLDMVSSPRLPKTS